jgi:hypothetical protein
MDVRGLILLLFLGVSFLGYAKDLRPQDLKITLEQLPVLEHQTDIIPLRINIQNVSYHRGSILVPHAQNYGNPLFQLRVYEIDQAGQYNLVYTSQEFLDMDTSKYKTEGGFWQLEPNERYSLPLFVNDTQNARLRYESSIQIPDLKNGKYAFQVLYTPENSSFFKYAFRQFTDTDPIPEDDVDEYPDHFIWEGSFASNFLEYPFEILPKLVVNDPTKSAFCRAVRKENWSKLKRIWRNRDKNKSCDCVLWVYGDAQSILASLPAYTGYDVIFYTDSDIKYVSFTYQIGKVFRLRARMNWLFHAVGFRRGPFKTSKVNWSKLIRLEKIK